MRFSRLVSFSPKHRIKNTLTELFGVRYVIPTVFCNRHRMQKTHTLNFSLFSRSRIFRLNIMKNITSATGDLYNYIYLKLPPAEWYSQPLT